MRISATAQFAAFVIGCATSSAPSVGPLPATTNALDRVFKVEGLSAPVRLLVDRYGITHIYANSINDVFWAQGFNVARDRLWQIDLWRRRGLGRLSEAFGPAYVDQDRASRLFLYRGDMAAEWRSYGPDAKQITTAFVAGINAFIEQIEDGPALLPIEFQKMGYRPARWEADDVVRIRSHGLSRNVSSEVTRAKVACAAGLAADDLRVRLEPHWTATVPVGFDVCSLPPNVLDVYHLATSGVIFAKPSVSGQPRAARSEADPDAGLAAAGSNNWALAPARTTTGRPILGNDPHRAHQAPSLRYITHLHAPGLNVIGAGEPALPGVSIGHNERIAFGLTIFSIDQEDLYAYDTNPANPKQYRYRAGFEDMVVIEERIAVKGDEARPAVLKFTRHGPVIFEDAANRRAYAVRTAWLQPGTAPYFGSMPYLRAQSWEAFVAALDGWGTPSLNHVFADVEGNVGWVPAGLTPVRRNWDGLLPVPGDGRFEWDGFMPASLLPRVKNPPEGYLATANECNLPASYPIAERRVGFEWIDPSRRQRIEEVLSPSGKKFSVRDLVALQADDISMPGRRMVAVLRNAGSSDAKVMESIELLRGWDGVTSAGSPAAALFEVWFAKHLRQAVIKEIVPPSAVPLIGAGDAQTILGLLEHPDSRLGAAPQEKRDEILRASLKAARAELDAKLSEDPRKWQWGKLHHAFFEHPLSPAVESGLREKLDVGPLPMPGSGFTVRAAHYRPADFRLTGGASFRMVIDVGRWDGSMAVNAPGQSGDPASPHYRDLVPAWLAGDQFPLFYSDAAVEAATETRIDLVPAR